MLQPVHSVLRLPNPFDQHCAIVSHLADISVQPLRSRRCLLCAVGYHFRQSSHLALQYRFRLLESFLQPCALPFEIAVYLLHIYPLTCISALKDLSSCATSPRVLPMRSTLPWEWTVGCEWVKEVVADMSGSLVLRVLIFCWERIEACVSRRRSSLLVRRSCSEYRFMWVAVLFYILSVIKVFCIRLLLQRIDHPTLAFLCLHYNYSSRRIWLASTKDPRMISLNRLWSRQKLGAISICRRCITLKLCSSGRLRFSSTYNRSKYTFMTHDYPLLPPMFGFIQLQLRTHKLLDCLRLHFNRILSVSIAIQTHQLATIVLDLVDYFSGVVVANGGSGGVLRNGYFDPPH